MEDPQGNAPGLLSVTRDGSNMSVCANLACLPKTKTKSPPIIDATFFNVDGARKITSQLKKNIGRYFEFEYRDLENERVQVELSVFFLYDPIIFVCDGIDIIRRHYSSDDYRIIAELLVPLYFNAYEAWFHARNIAPTMIGEINSRLRKFEINASKKADFYKSKKSSREAYFRGRSETIREIIELIDVTYEKAKS
jgi:hypothetical protein